TAAPSFTRGLALTSQQMWATETESGKRRRHRSRLLHSRFPWVIDTVSTLRERRELFCAGHRESWIARRNGHDDIASALILVYPVAHLLGGRNSFILVQIDAAKQVC